MYVSQVIMATLPNIELVSFLIILTTRKFGIKSLWSVYIFVFLEVITYGFEIWVVCYLYVWAILVFVTLFVRKLDSVILYTLISSIFGFLFGALCSVPYFITGGIGYGISWIVSGIVTGFDIYHGVGNFLIMLLLYKPISAVFDKIK
jgi:energy-coupling factor transport system substrate-specific component